ncbi:chemotaxis protein [Candidatus Photodesmus blepharus]|uniref:Chemotaxis protein CheA n=1 Tax=Candidatus Photodesmus blepharonis TaxID=1179155 RepID=A0A084CMW7_9GAMM|nr:chemotaxis protein CheA [Candidatus Photodesmus blepharus]KEY91146.1 chemotaxis protein [Candidatus Photodesmus blepharus]
MSYDLDEDILQDFLAEACEILDLLSEQLVELENNPEDKNLLNAIFRGFHTVKGGAGFLSLSALVDICHGAENVFDILRNGQRSVTSGLMDTMLRVLDSVNEQFQALQRKEPLIPVNQNLLNELQYLSKPELDNGHELISQELNDAIEKKSETGGAVDDISQDEFSKLLDELHGSSQRASRRNVKLSTLKDSTVKSNNDNLMTEDEFEELLDDLHGLGQGPKPMLAPGTSISEQLEPTTQLKKIQVSETTVRVDTSTLDTIMNMVGELVLVRNRLLSLGLNSSDQEMFKAVSNLDIVTADLQGAVMKTRMQPIKKIFGRFPRVVRDLARSLKKDISLEMNGEDTDLDKNLVEALADPLVHLIRNSVDHGIEIPDDRIVLGKSRVGKVILSASQEGDHIELSITDDGAGMDPNKLRKIAVQRGLMDKDTASRLDNKECFNLIFMPGFSSKENVSDISGRGVGMDVVKTAINTLNGSIDIDSEIGKGTKITIQVPLTLAILPTLIIGVGKYPFALPLANVNEIFHLDLSRTNVVDGQLTIIVRDKSIPLFYLQEWLIPKSDSIKESEGHGHVVIVQIGVQRVGFVVDALIGQEEVVIKPLDNLLQGTPGMAGATIASDGHIALILDVPDLLKQYAAIFRI